MQASRVERRPRVTLKALYHGRGVLLHRAVWRGLLGALALVGGPGRRPVPLGLPTDRLQASLLVASDARRASRERKRGQIRLRWRRTASRRQPSSRCLFWWALS